MATIWPSWMRTMVSDSLTELDANGNPRCPRPQVDLLWSFR